MTNRPVIVEWFAAPILVLCLASATLAHPIPNRGHDRTISVRLTVDPAKNGLTVIVRYRLELDPFTVVYDDLPALRDKVDYNKLKNPNDFYQAFANAYAPVFADNLVA